MDININPQSNFAFLNNNTDNKLKNINRELNPNKIRNKINKSNNENFNKILNNIKNEYGNKFLGKDKDLAPNSDLEKKLLDSAIELESMFINMMYKSMRNTLNKEDDPLYGGMTEDIFTDMMYNEYSKQTSKTYNLGLAKQIYLQNLPLIRNSISIDELA